MITTAFRSRRPEISSGWLLSGLGFLCFLVLWLDTGTALGLTVGILYIPFILTAVWFERTHTPIIFASIATAFTIVGGVLSRHGNTELWIQITNRTFVIAAFWSETWLIYLCRNYDVENQVSLTLKAVVDSVQDGIITITRTGSIKSFNLSAIRIFGYQPEEVIGRNVKILMPEPYHTEHDGYLSNYLKTGEAKIIGMGREVSGRRKDGSIFPMELHVNEMSLSGEQLFMGSVRDISVLRKADDQLREQADSLASIDFLYRQLVDGLKGFAIYRISPEGLVESWSNTAERIKGYTAEEIIGQKFLKFYTEADRLAGTPDHALETARKTGEYNGEHWHIRKDGQGFMASIVIYALRDTRGRLIGFSYILQDITERNKTKEAARVQATALAESNYLYRQLVDSLSDFAIYRISPEGLVESWSNAAERIKGYTAEEIIGQKFSVFYSHEDQAAFLPEQALQTAANIGHYTAEGRHIRKDGSDLWAGVVIYALRDQKEVLVGFSNITQDMTERRETAKALQQHLLDLKRSNQELDDFAHIASHDLKEPLRGLSTNALFLREDYSDKLGESGIKRLDRMVYLCERLERLVNDLLYFSRLGRQELAVQKADLNAVVHDIALMMETTLQEQNVAIRIPQRLPTITCDLPRVTEALRNLITNAVKYNDKPEKIIEIGFIDGAALFPPKQAPCVFYVKDNGIGIPIEFREEVFRIFKRLNQETDDEKGTGVGLTFVRKIIERHEGEIWIESEVGQGSTFYFTLNEKNRRAHD